MTRLSPLPLSPTLRLRQRTRERQSLSDAVLAMFAAGVVYNEESNGSGAGTLSLGANSYKAVGALVLERRRRLIAEAVKAAGGSAHDLQAAEGRAASIAVSAAGGSMEDAAKKAAEVAMKEGASPEAVHIHVGPQTR